MRNMAEALITVRLDDNHPVADPVATASLDAVLVERLQNCDQDAYETLLARFQQPIYNLCYRLINDPADAASKFFVPSTTFADRAR
jgi:hypothetical protein